MSAIFGIALQEIYVESIESKALWDAAKRFRLFFSRATRYELHVHVYNGTPLF